MPTAPPQAQSPMAAALVVLVRVYQRLVSPVLVALFGPQCRFEPSCSRYAVACLETHGAWRGSLLSLVRLCKCHPFHRGGFDPPPPRRPLPTPTSTLEAPRQVRRPEPAPHPSAPPS